MSDSSIKGRKCRREKVEEELITENEQSKAIIRLDQVKEMKLVKSWDIRFPYRFVRGNNDYTPLRIKDKKVQEVKMPIDMADFASLFFTENFIPAKLPVFFFDETSSLITGLLTGFKYRYGAFPLEYLLKQYQKKKIEEEIPPKGIVVEMEPLKEKEILVETFRVFLEETETFKLYSRGSDFIDPDPEPFVFYVESPVGGNDIYHSVIKSKEIIITDEKEENKTDTKNQPKATFFRIAYDNSASTMTPFQSEKAIVTGKVEYKSQSVTASPSDIHDSMEFLELDEDKKTTVKIDHSRLYNSDLDRVSSTSVLDSPHFKYVYNVVERILDSNYYQKAQILFEHVHLNEDVDINHSLSSFITLKLPKKVCMNKICEVTSLSWHPLNKHLLGVAYGKMHSEKTAKGIVCLWNLKNPTLPERLYKFKYSIKSIVFSAEYPYLLTVGFSNGHVAILNILAKRLFQMGDTFNWFTDYMPITHLAWFKNEYGDYYPVSSNESGEIYRYNIKRDFIPELVLNLPRQVEPVKGIKQFSKHFCRNEDKMHLKISISTFTQHPNDPLHYLVGTFDGYVHICSTYYKSRALDVFAAHEGPITNIDFHPKTDKFFLTCGCDYYIRVWYYKLFLPLISFSARKEFVYYAKWCVSNPLLIIGMSDMYIDVWDLRRVNDTIPASTYENTDHISYLTFNVSPFGPNLMVGDVDGNVMLFMINEIRAEPVFRIEIFYSAVRNHVSYRDPALWKRLKDALPECDVETHKECADILDV